MNVGRMIHPGQYIAKKFHDLALNTVRVELGDPDRATCGDFAGLVDVLFEVVDVFGLAVPGMVLEGSMVGIG